MKKLLFIVILALASYHQTDAQTITLVPDETYGKGNDWDKIFDTYYDTLDGRPNGLRKKLVVFDDGKAMVSHANKNRYSLFDANGKFLKDIAIYFADKGKKPRNLQPVEGRLGDLYFTKPNNMGDIYLFDDNGLIKKELKINYLAKEMLALPLSKKNLKSIIWQRKCWHWTTTISPSLVAHRGAKNGEVLYPFWIQKPARKKPFAMPLRT